MEQAQARTDVAGLVVMGYCFGGAVALEMARSDMADMAAGYATFHGGLGTPEGQAWDGDEPPVAGFPEPRLRSSCHDKPSSYRLMKTMQQAERFASRVSDGDASEAPFDLSLGTILYQILYQAISKSS